MLDSRFELMSLLAVALGLLGLALTLHDPRRTRASAYRWMVTFAILALLCLYATARIAHAAASANLPPMPSTRIAGSPEAAHTPF